MAKDDIGGVWRTIGGRRVFIKDGQDLATAMKESGKFGNKANSKKEVKETLSDRDVKDLLKQLNDEGSDFTFDDDVKIEDGKIKTSVGVFMPDERGYVERDLEIPISKNETYSSLEEKIRDWQDRHSTPDTFEDEDFESKYLKQRNEEVRYEKAVGEYKGGKDIGEKFKKSGNDYLPKETEIKSQGTSNRKEVSENIQAHILDYYDNPVDFMEQMDAMDYLPTKWKAGEEIAKGGSYLIYNGDMSDYLDKLKINPKGKKFSDEKSFEMYTSLIGRESERLYNRLEKLYNQYKAEHKNSNVSLDDFRKWFK